MGWQKKAIVKECIFEITKFGIQEAIIHEVYDPATTSSLLTINPNIKCTRKSNNLNLQKNGTNRNKNKMFFTNRINNTWNNLPNDVVNADDVNDFKNKFDKHFSKYTYLTDLSFYYTL